MHSQLKGLEISLNWHRWSLFRLMMLEGLAGDMLLGRRKRLQTTNEILKFDLERFLELLKVIEGCKHQKSTHE